MHPFRHFATITRHRHRVIAHCFRAGIGWQGLFHDLSKYTPTEFWAGARYYQGTRSPNEEERAVKMFCDRVAASKIYRGKAYTDSHPLEYFLAAKSRRRIHPATSDLLEGWLRMLSEQGEEATFAHVRQTVKQGDY